LGCLYCPEIRQTVYINLAFEINFYRLIQEVEIRLKEGDSEDTKIEIFIREEEQEEQGKKYNAKELEPKYSSAKNSKSQTTAKSKKRNQMSFNMKTINFESFNYMENQNSDAGKQISSFSCRADVVYKKILREFRRFYISDFIEITGIKDLGKILDKEEVEEALLEYTDEVFPSETSNRNLIAYRLGSILIPLKMTGSIFDIHKSKKDVLKVYDTLYKFSITKVDKMMQDKLVCLFMRHFLSIENNTQDLIEALEVSADAYRKAIELLQKRCEETLASSNA
jgi:hypothetical protein